jgi:hypothetical protein
MSFAATETLAGTHLVREWAALHEDELQENWSRCEQRLPLQPVEPLP